jgi:hypothetical protein
VSWAPLTGPTAYTDCALKCPGVSFDFLTAAASSSTTGPSVITYTYGQSTSTWLYKSDMPLPACTLSSSSTTGVVLSTETGAGSVGSVASSTGSVASPTKTSDGMRMGGRDTSWCWKPFALGIMWACTILLT